MTRVMGATAWQQKWREIAAMTAGVLFPCPPMTSAMGVFTKQLKSKIVSLFFFFLQQSHHAHLTNNCNLIGYVMSFFNQE